MRILLFAPYSAIWQHAFPEALAADALKQGGHEITYVTCGEMLSSICISMRANGLSIDSPIDAKQRICRICNENKELIKKGFNFDGFDISTYLTNEDKEFVDTQINKISHENYYDFQYAGIPLGRLATYETMLQYKKNNLDMSHPDEWASYVVWLKNAFYVACAAPKILDAIKPDRIVIYSNTYSSNNVFNFCAKQRDIPSYSMTAWDNLAAFYQGFIMVKGYNLTHWYTQFEAWNKVKNKPFPGKMLAKALPHILSQIQSRTFLSYSKAKQSNVDILKYFGISRSQKIAVAMMSSYDEIIASYAVGEFDTCHGKIFVDQLEWIKGLIDFFKNRPDLFLIVRTHPREFPNHREKQKSKNAILYEEALSNLPSNIRVNWPADNLSIYDLAEYADVILNGFSSSGLEMSLLGLPVLSYANEWNTYPIDLDIKVDTKEEYFLAIDRALESGWSFERIRLAYRWLAFKFSLTTFDISDAFKMQPGEPIRKYLDVAKKPKTIAVQKNICAFIESGATNYGDLIDESVFEGVDEDAETKIIIKMLNEVHHSLYSKKIELYFNLKKLVKESLRDIHNGIFANERVRGRLFSNLKKFGRETVGGICSRLSAKNVVKGKLHSNLTKFLKEASCIAKP